MTEDTKYTCEFCKSKTGGDDGFIYCPYCGEPYDAEGYEPSRPLPCIRDEHGHIDMQEVKSLILKIHEELIELEEAIVGYTGASINFNGYAGNEARAISDADRERIAEEAADLKTAVTTLENALYIQESMRDKAQRRVNEKNRSRGRL